eukprot:SAG31_NODE_35681_length_320_cov_2.891403_1_plen_54_part_10
MLRYRKIRQFTIKGYMYLNYYGRLISPRSGAAFNLNLSRAFWALVDLRALFRPS